MRLSPTTSCHEVGTEDCFGQFHHAFMSKFMTTLKDILGLVMDNGAQRVGKETGGCGHG